MTTRTAQLRWVLALPLVAALVAGCGGHVSISTKPSTLTGARIAKKANAQLEKENPKIVHGTLTCADVKYEKGAKTRCLRTVDLDQGRQVKIGATVTITDTTKGGHYVIQVDQKAQEFGELGATIEQDLATQYAKKFRTGKPQVTCPAYLKGVVGTSITCQLVPDNGKIEVVVTVSKVDPTNFNTLYTFKQK
jgi:hypothetical protein